jgi:hypothetical protein
MPKKQEGLPTKVGFFRIFPTLAAQKTERQPPSQRSSEAMPKKQEGLPFGSPSIVSPRVKRA